MKKLLASAAVAAAMTLGSTGAAHANVYTLNVDGCSGSGCGYSSYGTVTTSGEGTTSMTVTYQLAANVYFNFSGHPEETFDLLNNTNINIGLLTNPPWSPLSNQAAGSTSVGPFGPMDYHIDWGGTFQNAQHPGNGFPSSNGCLPSCGIQTLTFTVTPVNGTTLITPDFTVEAGKNVYFTADVAAFGVNGALLTGNVGATLTGGGVPEPATWAMMLTGFFGMGGLLRRRRAVTA